MGDTLTLPVPEALYGTYAVAFADPPADPREEARQRVTRRIAPPLRDLVLGMLASPMLTLDLRPAGEFPPLPTDLLALYGASPVDLAAVTGATHVLAVRAAYRPGWPPAHEWAARAVAFAVAEGAPVIDVFTPQILTPDRLADSLPGPDGEIRLTDWMLLPHTAGPQGFWFTTKGLARFGLPELQTEHVPPALVEPWGRLLNGLARRVLDLWLDELPAGEQIPLMIDLPELVSVGLQDVAAAQGVTEPMRREVTVRLRLDAVGGEQVLTVLTAEDGPTRLETLCAALFGTPGVR
ncbi:hypothetical protein GCM10009678_58370 [Actinomadura kijaniata]|uniref:Uncharacterized protein n=1 Tax=Actinomadura namibiensis TaxID=182080 RepID=A0A7W3LYH6_ACTNM|nr:hypothetical protein [Actinomadura namibiensis]MBA8956671.1 hypothetical protein [Actinomadura namibiensis]